MTRTCKEIRGEFIEFFKQRGHTFAPSSSLLPADDPTLLFANAGMNQFKDVFLGQGKRDYTRAVNSQKCIRAGGKHNDLEDVGHDTYHHTFFEMLGNWSFGDYFKADAIAWAWELLTKVWGLPKNRLHVTVFGGDKAEGLDRDTEAEELWKKVTDIDHSHIHYGNKKDNFWEMGDTGPCGPCSEIHYDFTPDLSGGKLVNASDARVIEIWNLVFMQFNRGGDGKLSPLPAKHVDTGMGFERICRVLQGVDSNYDIDVFRGIFDATQKLSAAGPYTGILEDIKDTAYRVIADHARTLTFAIADGIIPSNEGRGYVVRRILRRAVRYGRQYLGIEGPFMHKLVPTVVGLMSDPFHELAERQKAVVKIVLEEEESFGKTLDRGIDLFKAQAAKVQAGQSKVFPGDVAFELYATYGFPMDLTQLMAGEMGLKVDQAGYDAAMAQHRETSSAGADKFKVEALVGLPATNDSAKYHPSPLEAQVLGFVIGGKFVTDQSLKAGDEAAVVLEYTNFYGEQGGQVGDTGTLDFVGGSFRVDGAALAGQCVLHVGRLTAGTLSVGDAVTAVVGPGRMDIMRNHTATHLLNWALREVLGDHVHQAGSIVAADRLRFDFANPQAVTPEQQKQVETLVNDRILADEPITVEVQPLAVAKKIPGVRAVFGEKYPDPVRVVSIGDGATAAEFCGGTHLSYTGQVGLLKIVGEESVAKGVRRITAVTGHEAVRHVQRMDAVVREVGAALRTTPEEFATRIAAMQKEIKELKKRPGGGASAGAEMTIQTPAGLVIVMEMSTADPAGMRSMGDQQRQKGAAAVFIGGAGEGKVTLIAMVDEALAASGKLKAGDWVKAIAPIVGGTGGGKPTSAQAGGKVVEKLAEALQAAGQWANEKLK